MPTVNVYRVPEGWRVECECGSIWIFEEDTATQRHPAQGQAALLRPPLDELLDHAWDVRPLFAHLSGLDGTHAAQEKGEKPHDV